MSAEEPAAAPDEPGAAAPRAGRAERAAAAAEPGADADLSAAAAAEPGADADPSAAAAKPRTSADGRGAHPDGRRPERELPRRGLRDRIRDLGHGIEEAADSNRLSRFLVYMVRIFVQVVRKLARDRCPQQAASLSFQTLLSVVPLLGVALAFLRATGAFGAESTLVEFLSKNLIPVSRQEVATRLTKLSQNVTFESLGLVGLVTSICLAFIIVNSLEKMMNDIWRAERKRPLTQKFVVFYASATMGAFLVGTSLVQAAEFGLTSGGSGLVLSILSSFVAMFLALYLLPAARVRPASAAIGALFSTALFEVSKYAFSLYVTDFALKKYSGLYGALAVAPLLLIWIYYSWLMLLLGAEVSYAAQNLHILERVDRRGAMSLENELVRRVNGVVGARVMTAIVEAYVGGKKVLSRRALESRFDLSEDALVRLTDRLKQADLVIEVEGEYNGFVPARPPHEITLADVLEVFRGDDVVVSVGPQRGSRLDRVLGEVDRSIRDRTRSLALDELVEPDGER